MTATFPYNGLDNRCGATTAGQKLNIRSLKTSADRALQYGHEIVQLPFDLALT